MDEYFEHYKLFYDQKVKYDSNNPLHVKCIGCNSKKHFTKNINKDSRELILSCGDNDDDRCGVQFKVTLPEYIHKDKEINNFKRKLLRGLDNKGFNYTILHKYDLLDDSLKKNEDYVEEQKKGIQLIIDQYSDIILGENSKRIKAYYENRMNLSKEARLTMNIIKESYDDEGLLKESRDKYIGIIKQLNDEYLEVQQFFTDYNPNIMIDDPNVDIINDDYKENLKPNKKEKKKNKTFSSACDKIMCPEDIHNVKDFKKWARRNHPDKKHGENSQEERDITAKFQEVLDCKEIDNFCSKKYKDSIPIPKKKKNKKNKKEKTMVIKGEEEDDEDKEEGYVEDKEEDVDEDESIPIPKKKKKKKKKPVEEDVEEVEEVDEVVEPVKSNKNVTIDDFKLQDKVEWKQNTKIMRGTVYEINKRKKKSIKIFTEAGVIKDIDISKLKII